MKRIYSLYLLFNIFLIFSTYGESALIDLPPVRIDDFRRITQVRSYTPDNLYEYIDGAADNYLSYEFRQVVTTDYGKGDKSQVVTDIYRMESPEYAFGIYSSERPPKPDKINIGVEGYQGQGVLNFCKGEYYVKIMGFELGEVPDVKMRKIADVIAEKIQGTAELPPLFKLFPQANRVKGSERFVAKNVMGQEFLSKGYFVNFILKEGSLTTAFLFELENTEKAKETYIKFKSNLKSDSSGLLLATCKDRYLLGVRRPPDLKEGADFIKRWSDLFR